jgi:hypothetical protein
MANAVRCAAGHLPLLAALTWLASGMATKAVLCVAKYEAAGPICEGPLRGWQLR